MTQEADAKRKRAIVAAVQLSSVSDLEFEASLEELRQLAVTEEVLDEIGAKDVPRLIVFKKIDRAGDEPAQREREAALRAQYPGCIVMSARREGDIAGLHPAIAAFFRRDLVEAELFLPWAATKQRSTCKVLEERADGEGAFLRVRRAPADVKRLRELFGRE